MIPRSIYLFLSILSSAIFYGPLMGQSETLEPVVSFDKNESEIESVNINNRLQYSDFHLYISKTSNQDIMGEWSFTKQEAKFTPALPLDATDTYYLKYNTKNKEQRWLTLATEVDGSDLKTLTPEIVSVYPTTDNLPENLLRFYLEFSSPMLENEFQNFVEILDENGNQVQGPFLNSKSEYWNRDHTKLTLFFHPGRVKKGLKANQLYGRPLKAGHTYTLVVKPGWKSRQGVPSQTSFSKTFKVSPEKLTKVNPNNWEIYPPQQNSKEELIIDFGQPIDHINAQTFIVLLDNNNKEIEGRIALNREESIWEFTPHRPWKGKKLTIVIDKTLEDISGNNLISAFDTKNLIQTTANTKEKSHKIRVTLR
ncbi:MAG: hypothetical protein AAFN93_21750 [Bacteroidota bacterium]